MGKKITRISGIEDMIKAFHLRAPNSPIFYMKPQFNTYSINMKEDIYQQIKKMTESTRTNLAKNISKNIHRGLKKDIAVKKVLDKHFPEAYL